MVASIASINDITNNNINSSGSLHEMRYRIKDIVAKYFSDFYSNALVFVLAVFLAASFVSIKAWDNIQNDAKCSDMKGSAEELWRVSCTAVLVPLLLESTLDLVVNFFFSHLREDNTKVVKRLEDPFGHILIICSLIPSSYIPLWIMGNHACISRDTFVSFGHTVAMYGIVGKLQSFSSDLWASTSALWFVLLFASSQIAMIMGLQREDDVIGYDEKTLQIGTTLKLIAFVTFLTTSFRIPLNILFHSKEDVTQNSTSHFFVTRSYLCGILWISVVIFFIQTIHFGLHNMDAYNEMQHDYDIWSFRVKAHIFLVVLTAVLPGRIIRRGLAAMEKNIAIENEMNYKKTFVRYVSHEVRSPLSTTGLAIDCLIQLLTSKKRLNREELLDLAKDSKITCTAAMQTLNDLLLFDKIESNMLQMEFQETPCKQFLCDCIRPFMRQLSLGKILFSVNIQEELRDYTLKIDQHKLEQVIRNFMGNAVKFTSQNGSINVTASLLSKAPSNPEDEEKTLLRFEVKDSGAGISEANLKKLFGQYVQFNANKLQGGNGSGLGLWISKAIIDKHGGFVGAYSKGEGCGTTFFFEMEIFHGSNQVLQADNIVQEGFGDLLEGESLASEEYQDLDPIVSNAKSPQMTERLLSSKTAMSTPSGVVGEESFSEVALKLQEKKFSLLLADDSILARKMVERLINNTKIFAGQPILHANNGKEAVDKVLDSINNGKPIDVVLIDYYMPGMSGPEAIKLLREQNFKGVIFALTASNSEDNTFKLAEAGADLILPKPFDVNLFSAKLADKLGVTC